MNEAKQKNEKNKCLNNNDKLDLTMNENNDSLNVLTMNEDSDNNNNNNNKHSMDDISKYQTFEIVFRKVTGIYSNTKRWGEMKVYVKPNQTLKMFIKDFLEPIYKYHISFYSWKYDKNVNLLIFFVCFFLFLGGVFYFIILCKVNVSENIL